MNMKSPSVPLLSICIPTCMRASILEKTINELLILEDFDDEVQLVISDNASSDQTPYVVENAIAKYPNKNIKYNKNKENIGIQNFLVALECGDGIYRKLLNDYISLDNVTLCLMKEKIRKYISQDFGTFWLCFYHNIREWKDNTKNELTINCVDDFILTVNNKITWVTNFGCFSSQVKELNKFNDKNERLLSLMYWALHLSKTRTTTIIVNINKLNSSPVPSSSRILTYNFFMPHVVWYYQIINEFTQLPPAYLRKDKKRLITDFVGNMAIHYLILRNPCGYELKGSWNILLKYFYNIPEFYLLFIRAGKIISLNIIKLILRRINLLDYAKKTKQLLKK